MSAPSAIFTPTPDRAARLLADLNDTSLSFDDLAAKHGTSTEALSLWLSTSAIKDRVYLTLDAMSLRIRAIAASRLPQALRAITELIEANPVLQAPALGPSGTGAPDDTLREREFRRRHNETIRRACTVLLRLANFFSPTRPPALRPHSPGPAGESRSSAVMASCPTSPPPLASFPAPVPVPVAPAAPLSRSPGEVPRFAGVRASSSTPLPSLADQPAPAARTHPAIEVLADPQPTQNSARSSQCSQPEGLKVNSRGQSESASAAPGKWSRSSPHPEGVRVATAELNSTDSSPRTQHACPAPSAIADPRPPPSGIPGAYQRPRQRFKVRR